MNAALPVIQTEKSSDLRQYFQDVMTQILESNAVNMKQIKPSSLRKSSQIGSEVDSAKLFSLHKSFMLVMQKSIQDFIHKTLSAVTQAISKPNASDTTTVEEQREAALVQEDYQIQQIEQLKGIRETLEKILKAGGMGGKGGGDGGGLLDTLADAAMLASFLKGGKLARIAKVAKAGKLTTLAKASKMGKTATTAAKVSDTAVKTASAIKSGGTRLATRALSSGKQVLGLGAKAGGLAAGASAASGIADLAGAASSGAGTAIKAADAAGDVAKGTQTAIKAADTAGDVAKGASAVSGAVKGTAEVAETGAKTAGAVAKGGARGLSKFLGPLSLLLDAGFGGYAIYQFMDLLDQKKAGAVSEDEFQTQGKSLWVEIVRSLGYPAIGAIIGSVVPGLGTLAGGVIGSTVGALDMGAEWLTGWSPAKALGEYIFETAYMGDESKAKEIEAETQKNNEAVAAKKQTDSLSAPAPTPPPSLDGTSGVTPETTAGTAPATLSAAAPVAAIPPAGQTESTAETATPVTTPSATKPTPTGNIKTITEDGVTTKAPVTPQEQESTAIALQEQVNRFQENQIKFAQQNVAPPPPIINNYYNSNISGGGSSSNESSAPMGQPSESVLNSMLSSDAHGARMGINS